VKEVRDVEVKDCSMIVNNVFIVGVKNIISHMYLLPHPDRVCVMGLFSPWEVFIQQICLYPLATSARRISSQRVDVYSQVVVTLHIYWICIWQTFSSL